MAGVGLDYFLVDSAHDNPPHTKLLSKTPEYFRSFGTKRRGVKNLGSLKERCFAALRMTKNSLLIALWHKYRVQKGDFEVPKARDYGVAQQ
jgi:hypothetical protein